MDDGVLEGMEIISAIGDSDGKLDVADLDEDFEGLEECVGNLCRMGLIKKENDFLYLTESGKSVYQELQKSYSG